MAIPLDKQAHALGGAVITLAISMVLLPVLGLWPALACSLLAAIVIGALKELYDHYHPLTRTCDFYDWLATTLGGLFVGTGDAVGEGIAMTPLSIWLMWISLFIGKPTKTKKDDK